MARRSVEEKRRLLAAWEASGLGKAAFARKHGLSPNSLYRWKKALGPAGFVEVQVARVPAALVVHVRDHVRIEVPADFDARALRRLVDALC